MCLELLRKPALSSTHSLESVTMLVFVIYDSVGKDRLFHEGSWSRNPSVFTRVGDPVVGGGPSKCTSSLWSQFSDWLPGHEVLHIPPDSCSFIVWNMKKKIV